jgi:hypothetical protein
MGESYAYDMAECKIFFRTKMAVEISFLKH